MSNIFNFKRFSNYFLYDLRNAKNNYGVAFLVTGLSIIIAFVVVQSYGLLFQRHLVDMSDSVWQWIAVSVSLCIITLSAASRIYGRVTDKRFGSSFIMLPASTLEKTLSLCIILLIVLPVVLFAILYASDLLLSLCFPSLYGDSILCNWSSLNADTVDSGVQINFFAFGYGSWVMCILFFCLGALVFKKAKVAKTLLCGFALSFIVEAAVILSLTNGVSIDDFADVDPVEMFKAMNVFLNVYIIGLSALLIAGIYGRLKTIKL